MDKSRIQSIIHKSDNDVQYCLGEEKQSEIKLIVDLTHQGVSFIPDDFLINHQNVQYLYLEGNSLRELSKSFFPTLKQLKWLDVRNNKLTTVPETIVDHKYLQVLLLDGNNIETLPVEIGSLCCLRGLQLSRNPIVYPPLNVVNQGVQVTINYLQKQWQQIHSPQQIQLISETHSHSAPPKSKLYVKEGNKPKIGTCKSAVVSRIHNHKARNVQSGTCTASLNKCISVRPISQRNQQPTANNWVMSHDLDETYEPMEYERKGTYNDQIMKRKFPFQDGSKSNDKEEVKSHLLRDLWLEKIRQVLITQETILQRRRDAESLKQWQDEAKQTQLKYPKRGSGDEIRFPYDTHPGFLKMLSRRELSEDREVSKDLKDSSLQHTKQGESINCSIMSIMTALQEIQRGQSLSVVSPRSEQQVLAQEIKKIKDLQRSLNALKLRNFGQLNIN